MKQGIIRMRKKLKNELDKERFEHTLGVMYTAAALAMCYEEDVDSALTAGLLHDCAKCIASDTKIKLCDRYHLNVSAIELANPSLLHAKLGAFLAARKYGVRDKEVINAIASHTTGRPAMTLLEKIIYVADYMEPGREDLSNMTEVRRLAFVDLDECIYRIAMDSLTYLQSKNIQIDSMTEKTYEYYKAKLEKQEE